VTFNSIICVILWTSLSWRMRADACVVDQQRSARVCFASTLGARRIAAICTGGFVLAQAGLLDGRRATTHWAFAQELRKRYPGIQVEEDRI
jgi:transcriptional regulator GlxA family with amidase domain